MRRPPTSTLTERGSSGGNSASFVRSMEVRGAADHSARRATGEPALELVEVAARAELLVGGVDDAKRQRQIRRQRLQVPLVACDALAGLGVDQPLERRQERSVKGRTRAASMGREVADLLAQRLRQLVEEARDLRLEPARDRRGHHLGIELRQHGERHRDGDAVVVLARIEPVRER